jgi:hypothetical protein
MLQPLEPDTNSTQRAVWGRGQRAPTDVGSLAAAAVRGFRRSERTAYEGSSTTIESWPVLHLLPEIVVAKRPSPEDRLGAKLQSYVSLPHRWDGYEGVPAPLDAVTDALTFLAMRPRDIPLPYPQIGPDGEVGLYWHAEKVFAEISFYGGGEYSYHARCTSAEGAPVRQGRDGCSLDAGSWDAGLLLVLNKISR